MPPLQPEKWVSQYADLLYRFALVRVRDHEVSRDLVQETFIAAWKALPEFKGASSEKTWLYAILRNKIIDHFRAASRGLTERFAETPPEENAYFDEVDHWSEACAPREWGHRVEKKEFYDVLRRCTERLQAVQAAVFTMKYLDDLDSGEICKELKISASNYWVLLHRAKLQLRSCLEKNWSAR